MRNVYYWVEQDADEWSYENNNCDAAWYYLERNGDGFDYWVEDGRGMVCKRTTIPDVTTLKEAKQFIEVLARMS